MQRFIGCVLACVLPFGMAEAMSQQATPVHLSCQGPDADMTAQACNALADQIAGRPLMRAPDPAPDDALKVTLDITLADDRGMAGRLIWRNPGDPAVNEGAFVEVTISDSPMRRSTYERFVEVLLSESELVL